MENNRQVRKAMILAGGLGTRFLPQTLAVAKELVPIGNKPILMYHLEELAKAGVNDVLIVGNKLKQESFKNFIFPSEDYLQKLHNDGKLDLIADYLNLMSTMSVTYINQDDRYQVLGENEMYENPHFNKMGSAIAILAGQGWAAGEPFVVINGDDLCVYEDGKSASSELINIYNKTGDNVIYGRECPRELMYKYSSMEYGDSVADGKGRKMKNIIEKPAKGTEPSNVMGFARYVVNSDFFDRVFQVKPRGNGEYNMTDVFQKLANEGKVSTCLFKGQYYDCGNMAGYVLANLHFGLENPECKEQIRAGVQDMMKTSSVKEKGEE